MGDVLKQVDGLVRTSTAMVGVQDFVLSHTEDLTTSEAVVYFQAEDGETLRLAQEKIRNYMAEHYPHGTVEFGVSGNIFDLIFSNDDADLEIRLQRQGGGRPDVQEARAFWTLCRAASPRWRCSRSFPNATYNTWPTRSRWRCTMCRMPLYRLG